MRVAVPLEIRGVTLFVIDGSERMVSSLALGPPTLSYLHFPDLLAAAASTGNPSGMLSISPVSVTETLSKTLNRSFHGHQSAAHCETSHDGSGSKLPEPHQPQKLITISDLPSWYHDNPFVLSGYRPISNSTAKCVESLLYIHNETANIYTHLIAAVIFILAQSALQRYLTSLYPTIEIGDRLAIAFEGFTAAICFILSATYHSLICHSEPIFRLSLKCDYAGIIILIIGNFLSGLHISFHCAPTLARIYSFMVSFPRLSSPSRQAKMY
jgi:hypothetical protein